MDLPWDEAHDKARDRDQWQVSLRPLSQPGQRGSKQVRSPNSASRSWNVNGRSRISVMVVLQEHANRRWTSLCHVQNNIVGHSPQPNRPLSFSGPWVFLRCWLALASRSAILAWNDLLTLAEGGGDGAVSVVTTWPSSCDTLKTPVEMVASVATSTSSPSPLFSTGSDKESGREGKAKFSSAMTCVFLCISVNVGVLPMTDWVQWLLRAPFSRLVWILERDRGQKERFIRL